MRRLTQIPRSELEAARKAMMIVGRLSIVTTVAGAAKAWKDTDAQAFVDQHLQSLPEPLQTAVTIAVAATKLPVQVTDDIILYITGGIHSDMMNFQKASLHISCCHLPASALLSTVSDAAACNQQVTCGAPPYSGPSIPCKLVCVPVAGGSSFATLQRERGTLDAEVAELARKHGCPPDVIKAALIGLEERFPIWWLFL